MKNQKINDMIKNEKITIFISTYTIFYCHICRKSLGYKEPDKPVAIMCKKCYRKFKRKNKRRKRNEF